MCLSTLQEVRRVSNIHLSAAFSFWRHLLLEPVRLSALRWSYVANNLLRPWERSEAALDSRACSRFSVARSSMRRDCNILESSMKRIMIVWSIPRPHCGGDVGSVLRKATYDSEPEHSVSSRLWRYQPSCFFKAGSLYIEAKAKIPSFWFKWGKYNVESCW